MEASTTVKGILCNNSISVPAYQRAYSWDTDPKQYLSPLQVNTFLSDIDDYIESKNDKSKYYLGHFLFEEKNKSSFSIIDGQQRLTTAVIFLAVLFEKLKALKSFSEQDDFDYKSLIKLNETYHFDSVDYDKQFFRDYVINHSNKNSASHDTVSQRRLISAYKYFEKFCSNLDEAKIRAYMETICEASCTTHIVKDELEAIQMFIFQNNRGKRPTNLEVIKAQFLYHLNLADDENVRNSLIDEIRGRFEEIYKTISKIEHKVDEDDALLYALRIYYNDLKKSSPQDTINAELDKKDTKIDFIKKFTETLYYCFKNIEKLLDLEKSDINIHSLLLLAQNAIAFPFMLKALLNDMPCAELENLAQALDNIFIRARVVRTRADLTDRLKEVFRNMTNDPKEVIKRINDMKSTRDWWLAYWSNDAFTAGLSGWIERNIALKLLWHYENHLTENEGKNGYAPTLYSCIVNPQLEHIAPKTENPEAGYSSYTEEFRNKCLECLGNYLMLSESHNKSIGNLPFPTKRASYTQSRQQREIQDMTAADERWTEEKIKERQEKIINFLRKKFC